MTNIIAKLIFCSIYAGLGAWFFDVGPLTQVIWTIGSLAAIQASEWIAARAAAHT